MRTLHKQEMVEFINDNCVAVALNVTDDGYPHHIPVFERYECYSANPWPHLKSSHLAMISADGERLYSSTSSQILEAHSASGGFCDAEPAIRNGVDRFLRESRLTDAAKRGDFAAREELAALHGEMREEIEFISVPLRYDVRLMTAHALLNRGQGKWKALEDRLVRGERGIDDSITPFVRRLITYALGEFITDDRPFADEAAPYLEVIYAGIPLAEAEGILADVKAAIAASEDPERYMRAADFPIPRSLLERAAAALAAIHRIPHGADHDCLGAVRNWWSDNRIRFAPEPSCLTRASTATRSS